LTVELTIPLGQNLVVVVVVVIVVVPEVVVVVVRGRGKEKAISAPLLAEVVVGGE